MAVLFSRTGGYLPSPTAHAGIAVRIGIARGENHEMSSWCHLTTTLLYRRGLAARAPVPL